MPAGTSVEVGDWEVVVLSSVPDATESVLAENPFNDPPAEGNQFFIVEVAATYVGDESEALFVGLTFTTLGDSAVAYGAGEGCGVIPGEIDAFSEVFPGGSINGNLCWEVATSDVESLVLIVDHAFSLQDDRLFLQIPGP